MTRPRIPKQGYCFGRDRFVASEVFPGFQFFRNGEGRGWIGQLQPTAASPAYTVKVLLPGHGRAAPRVYVVKPRIEHWVHRLPDGALCLYYSGDGSWTADKLVARTIIPWAAEWLYFYELWKETGEWYGAEAPHNGLKLSG